MSDLVAAAMIGTALKTDADMKVASAQGRYEGLADSYRDYVFRAKSHVHGLRAGLHAHRQVEDDLIRALKAENANHPLASREAVDAAVEDHQIRALVDPAVIKKTYPDGVLPPGAVEPPNGTHRID